MMNDHRQLSEHCIDKEWCLKSGQCKSWLSKRIGCEAQAWEDAHGGMTPEEWLKAKEAQP